MTTATTVFEVGKLAWLMENNRVVSKDIHGIRITLDYKSRKLVELQVSKHWNLVWINTTNVFPTKEALIASL